MAGVHAGASIGETSAALDPLTVSATVGGSTPTPMNFSGTGSPINSSDYVEITASGGTGPYSVAFTRASGYLFSGTKNISSGSGYTNNRSTFYFEIPFPASTGTNFTADVTDTGGSGKVGSVTFTVNCTRTA